MNCAVLSLGSNVGDRGKNLVDAATHLFEKGSVIIKTSSIYETEPWGKKDQQAFYNQVISIETTLTASQLMKAILDIEKKMGRERKEKWEPRVIDIDILFFNEEQVHQNHLTIPHPYIQERKFVLVPLKEISPDYVHPVLKLSVRQMLENLNDTSSILKVQSR